MRWFLFAISLFALWFAFNMLFMISGSYSGTTFGLAATGITVGVAAAWFSGRQFILAWGRDQRMGEIVKAPPVVLCIFILCAFCAMAIIKIMAYR